MSWLFWGFVIVIAIFAIRGYCRGFIKVAFSLVAIILSIILVSVLTPYVKDVLVNRTDVYEKLSEKCTQAVEKKYQSHTKEEDPENEDEVLEGANISLPFAVKATMNVLNQGKASVEGLYEKAGRTVAMWILCALSFVLTLIIVRIIISLIEGALDLVTKLPVVHGTNQILGVAAGLLQGLLVIWIGCIILTVFCTSDTFDIIYKEIASNKYLQFVYEHNGIVYLASYFLI